mgnify:FL=1
MNKSFKIFLNIVIIAAVGLVAFLVIRNFMTDGKVQREIKEIYDLIYNSDEETYDLETIYTKLDDVVSNDGYAIVEIVAKDYLSDVFDKILELEDIINDERMNNVLTVTNYKEDGPNFTDTINYLDETKQKVLNLKASMLGDLEVNTIMSYIINEDLEESYIDLYGTLEFAKESNINKNKENIESAVDSFVSQIEGMENVIDFLIENKNEWEINDDMIVFDDTSLSNEYNDMISSIR